jgi:hypothetical protein
MRDSGVDPPDLPVLRNVHVFQVNTPLLTSTTLTNLLQEPVVVDENLEVGRQQLRTINIPSTPLGCAWDEGGVLLEMSVTLDVSCEWDYFISPESFMVFWMAWRTEVELVKSV